MSSDGSQFEFYDKKWKSEVKNTLNFKMEMQTTFTSSNSKQNKTKQIVHVKILIDYIDKLPISRISSEVNKVLHCIHPLAPCVN